MDLDEKEVVKAKMYAIITLSVIGVIILLIVMFVFSVKSFFDDLAKHQYYVVNINDSNKEEIKDLLNAEKLGYCESMYKIEYETVFPSAIFSKIYCKNEDDISLSIYDSGSKLIQYIHENGSIEKR